MLSMYINTDLLNPASQPNDSATESLEALVSLEVFLRRGWFGFFCLWAKELLFMELLRWWERIFGIGEALQIFSWKIVQSKMMMKMMIRIKFCLLLLRIFGVSFGWCASISIDWFFSTFADFKKFEFEATLFLINWLKNIEKY